jgi:hypothetical protein
MDIQLADVTVHIDETLDPAARGRIEDKVRGLDGVVSYHNPDDKPHLAVVEYDPGKVKSSDILAAVTAEGVHAELIGL